MKISTKYMIVSILLFVKSAFALSEDNNRILSFLIDNFPKYSGSIVSDFHCYDIVVLPMNSDTLIGITVGEDKKYWNIFNKHSKILYKQYHKYRVNIYISPSLDDNFFKNLFTAESIKVSSHKRHKHTKYRPLFDYEYPWCYFKFGEDKSPAFAFSTADSPSNLKIPNDEIINTLHLQEDQ